MTRLTRQLLLLDLGIVLTIAIRTWMAAVILLSKTTFFNLGAAVLFFRIRKVMYPNNKRVSGIKCVANQLV